MAEIVVQGAVLKCTFGVAPSTFNPSSQTKVMAGGKLAGTIMDCSPSCMTPFGMCQSIANPQVAAATAAAFGVLTPQPCMPVPAGPWIPTKTSVIAGGKPILTADCKLMCAWAGNITVNFSGQVKAKVK